MERKSQTGGKKPSVRRSRTVEKKPSIRKSSRMPAWMNTYVYNNDLFSNDGPFTNRYFLYAVIGVSVFLTLYAFTNALYYPSRQHSRMKRRLFLTFTDDPKIMGLVSGKIQSANYSMNKIMDETLFSNIINYETNVSNIFLMKNLALLSNQELDELFFVLKTTLVSEPTQIYALASSSFDCPKVRKIIKNYIHPHAKFGMITRDRPLSEQTWSWGKTYDLLTFSSDAIEICSKDSSYGEFPITEPIETKSLHDFLGIAPSVPYPNTLTG